MNSERKELLTFGYVRGYCKTQKIEFLPEDIIGLFIAWLIFGDHFDKTRVHPGLTLEIDDEYETLKIKQVNRSKANYCSAVGCFVIKKGEKQKWRFPIYAGSGSHGDSAQIGVVDENILKSSEEFVNDFTNTQWKGWGLYLYAMQKYYNDERGGTFGYATQFKYSKDDPLWLTMILDLTQETNENGVLSFDIEGEFIGFPVNHDSSKILYDNIDVDGEYRMAVALQLGCASGIKLCLSQ